MSRERNGQTSAVSRTPTRWIFPAMPDPRRPQGTRYTCLRDRVTSSVDPISLAQIDEVSGPACCDVACTSRTRQMVLVRMRQDAATKDDVQGRLG